MLKMTFTFANNWLNGVGFDFSGCWDNLRSSGGFADEKQINENKEMITQLNTKVDTFINYFQDFVSTI